MSIAPPPDPDAPDWVALTAEELPVALAHRWLVRDECGAVVQFTGTARDHSAGRREVDRLTYEAYEGEAVSAMQSVVVEVRRRWPDVVAMVVLHRTGELRLGDAAVHVGVSAAHRDVAFEAARFGIDALKAAVPIWKRERHSGGEDWGLDGSELSHPADLAPAWSDHSTSAVSS